MEVNFWLSQDFAWGNNYIWVYLRFELNNLLQLGVNFMYILTKIVVFIGAHGTDLQLLNRSSSYKQIYNCKSTSFKQIYDWTDLQVGTDLTLSTGFLWIFHYFRLLNWSKFPVYITLLTFWSIYNSNTVDFSALFQQGEKGGKSRLCLWYFWQQNKPYTKD